MECVAHSCSVVGVHPCLGTVDKSVIGADSHQWLALPASSFEITPVSVAESYPLQQGWLYVLCLT